MNLQQQYAAAKYLGTGLLVLGVFALAMAGGSYAGVVYLMGTGCSTQIFGQPSVCQQALQSLNTCVKVSLVAGVLSLVSAGGINYYLQRVVP